MKLALIHFQPPEFYPPIINFSSFLAGHDRNNHIRLYTNSVKNGLSAEIPLSKVKRVATFKPADKRFVRLCKTLWYNIYVTISLFLWRPTSLIYFETTSAFPAFVYLLFFRRRTRLFIHYHEYTSIAQYANGMWLDRIWHYLEKRFIYSQAYWISQTNDYRKELFLRDHPGLKPEIVRSMPNYPPGSWVVPQREVEAKLHTPPYRMLQLGSISPSHMYARELFEWLKAQNGLFQLDIYTFTVQDELLACLKEVDCPYVQIKGSVNYIDIPELLRLYDIGVILYKPTTENIVYCASNKLFEYLSGGLDVWVSDAMTGSAPYIRESVFPKVKFVDFRRLNLFDWQKAICRERLVFSPSPFNMEKVYDEWFKHVV